MKEYKDKKSKNKKNFFEKIFSLIKKIKIEEVLFIVILAIVMVSALGIITEKRLLSAYVREAASTSFIYYFDIFVRNGIFNLLYFALIVALVYWLAKKIIKKKIDIKKGVIMLVIGLVIAFVIYQLPPYYLHGKEPMEDAFLNYPGEAEINEIDHSGCGNRVDFLFSPSSGHGLKQLLEMQALKEQEMPINIYCIGDRWINDDIICRKKYGLDPKQGEKVRDELGIGKIDYMEPRLIIGCKYWIISEQNASVTKQFICDKTAIC